MGFGDIGNILSAPFDGIRQGQRRGEATVLRQRMQNLADEYNAFRSFITSIDPALKIENITLNRNGIKPEENNENLDLVESALFKLVVKFAKNGHKKNYDTAQMALSFVKGLSDADLHLDEVESGKARYGNHSDTHISRARQNLDYADLNLKILRENFRKPRK